MSYYMGPALKSDVLERFLRAILAFFRKTELHFHWAAPTVGQSFCIYISLLKLIPAVSVTRSCAERTECERRLVYSPLTGEQTFIAIL